jgi:hypothetical protein
MFNNVQSQPSITGVILPSEEKEDCKDGAAKYLITAHVIGLRRSFHA